MTDRDSPGAGRPGGRPLRGGAGRLAVAMTVVAAGAATLALELGASRVLAPRFGSGVQAWGALLGVVMGALALGYVVGGRLADRRPKATTLAATVALAAGLVALVPVLDAPLGRAAESITDHPGWGAALATVMLFGPPTVALATAGPVAVRLRAAVPRRSGRAAGDVLALSTVGSIAGSFAAAFWLIPEVGVSRLFLIVAAALGACSMLILATAGRRAALAAAVAGGGAAVAVLALSGAGAVGRDATAIRGVDGVLMAEESPYHRVTVVREGTTRALIFGSLWQSAWDPSRPDRHLFEYSVGFHLGLAQAARRERVLHIGLGGATMPRSIARTRPGVAQDAVEIDPVVVDAARRFFALDAIPGLAVHVDDGRRWVRRHPDRRFDAVLVDAYTSDGVPFHLFTRESARLLRGRLRPGGAIAVNLHGSLRGPSSGLWRSVHRTFAAELPYVSTFLLPAGGETLVRNVIMVASTAPIPSTPALVARWDAWRAGRGVDIRPALGPRVNAVDAGGTVFTDDRAPTDRVLDPTLRAAAREQRPAGVVP